MVTVKSREVRKMKVAVVMMMVVMVMVSAFGAEKRVESVGMKHYENAVKDGFKFCMVCKKAIAEKDCKVTNLAMKNSDDKAFINLANKAMKKFIKDRKKLLQNSLP